MSKIPSFRTSIILRLNLIKACIFYLSVIGFISSCVTTKVQTSAGVQTKSLSNNEIYLTRCSILDSDFQVLRNLGSGFLCLTIENGDWIEINLRGMRYWSTNSEILWQKKGMFHHQIKQLDKNSIIVLSAQIEVVDGERVKFDKVMKIDLRTGKTLAQFSVYEELYITKILRGTEFDRPPSPLGAARIFYRNAKFENTHVNSIHFYKELLIINQAFGQPFALTQELKLSPTSIWRNRNEQTHDLQILEDGSTLYFKNPGPDDSVKTFRIVHFDRNHQLIFEFPKNPADAIPNEYAGGVEKIGSNYLIGIPFKGKSIVELVTDKGIILKKTELPVEIQDVRRIQGNDFLKNNTVR